MCEGCAMRVRGIRIRASVWMCELGVGVWSTFVCLRVRGDGEVYV